MARDRDDAAVKQFNRALGRTTLAVRFGADGTPGLVSTGNEMDGALGSLASIVAVAQIDGTWSRLKACQGVRRAGPSTTTVATRAAIGIDVGLRIALEKARESRLRQRR